MDLDALIGCIILPVSVVILFVLTFWCRRRIERISHSHSRSAREIAKDLRGE